MFKEMVEQLATLVSLTLVVACIVVVYTIVNHQSVVQVTKIELARMYWRLHVECTHQKAHAMAKDALSMYFEICEQALREHLVDLRSF